MRGCFVSADLFRHRPSALTALASSPASPGTSAISIATRSPPVAFRSRPARITASWSSSSAPWPARFIAILIAVPLSVGAAIFLAEAVPPRLRPALSMLVELVAVVPSVVFGLWGIAVLVPFIGHYLSPTGNGYGLLAASVVLALMITPIIATTLLDALMQVPKENRESAFALGATHFEVVAKAMMPMVRTTLIGGIVLALGRALGETMAVRWSRAAASTSCRPRSSRRFPPSPPSSSASSTAPNPTRPTWRSARSPKSRWCCSSSRSR